MDSCKFLRTLSDLPWLSINYYRMGVPLFRQYTKLILNTPGKGKWLDRVQAEQISSAKKRQALQYRLARIENILQQGTATEQSLERLTASRSVIKRELQRINKHESGSDAPQTASYSSRFYGLSTNIEEHRGIVVANDTFLDKMEALQATKRISKECR